jgi:hypothetical protein
MNELKIVFRRGWTTNRVHYHSPYPIQLLEIIQELPPIGRDFFR